MSEFKLNAFVANLDKYNEGELVGEWVSFPVTASEMENILPKLGLQSIDSFGPEAADLIIADYTTDLPGDSFVLSPFESLDHLNYLAGRLQSMDDRELARFMYALQQHVEIPGPGVAGLINLSYNLDNIELTPQAVTFDGISLRPMLPGERMYSFTQSSQLIGQTGCIGHLRGDMDWSGDGFFSSWTDYRQELKVDEFKEEFDRLINALRTEDAFGKMLASRRNITKYGLAHPESEFSERYDTEFGFRADTEKYSYFLRLNSRQGDYNVYCYCYYRPWLEKHMERAASGIRFVTPNYKELFRIPDGGKIRITWKDGKTPQDITCRYIDDYHMETSSNNLYHICEFAEKARLNGAKVEPLSPVMTSRGKKINWKIVFDGQPSSIPDKYRLPAIASEETKDRVKRAMEKAGYHFNSLESDYGCIRFSGEQPMIFGSWAEAATWLDNVCFDDLEVGTAVDEILHPELHEKIRVLVVEPKKEPRIEEISSGLESLQQAVGGYIEAVYPFDDPVALICNEEGKLEGLPLNRGLYDDNGDLYDIIAGPMLVVGLTEDSFGSLSPELAEKYMAMYKDPQTFICINGITKAIPITDEGKAAADGLSQRVVSIIVRGGYNGFDKLPESQIQHTEEALSYMIRAGEDFSIRSLLSSVADNQSLYSKEAFDLIRDLDTFYRDQGVPRYLIYQIDFDGKNARDLCFRSYDAITDDGLSVDARNYRFAYSGRLANNETLDSLYERFNLNKPAGFTGHSMSVSDVIITEKGNDQKAFYVDSFGYKEVPEFLAHNPLEKVEEQLEDDYGMIDGIINNGRKQQEENSRHSVLNRIKEKSGVVSTPDKEELKTKKNRDLDLD